MTYIFKYPAFHKSPNNMAFKFENKNYVAMVAIIENFSSRPCYSSKKMWHIPFRNDYKEYLTKCFRHFSTVQFTYGELDTFENRIESSKSKEADSYSPITVK